MKAFTFVVAAENLVQLMQLIVDLKTHVFHYVYPWAVYMLLLNLKSLFACWCYAFFVEYVAKKVQFLSSILLQETQK